MNRAVFIVDIASCTGCYACSIACKDRAGLPDELDLLRVEEHEEGVYPDISVYYRVIHCFHCEKPPCLEPCPTQAISKGNGGQVAIDDEKCIGCGQCIEACPFDAIVMISEDIAAKCDACLDEVARGWEPTCVRACPMRALRYEPVTGIQFDNRTRDENFNDHSIGPAVMYLRRHKS